MACKPGSVHLCAETQRLDDHSSRTPVAKRLTRYTRTAAHKPAWSPKLLAILLDLAPGGVYRAVPVARDAVRSYRTLSPLPALAYHQAGRFAFCGTFPRVAPAGR